MEYRKDPLVSGEYYHVFSRSIARFIIFSDDDYFRFLDLINLYRFNDFCYKYSTFKNLQSINQKAIISSLCKQGNKSVEIIAYCLMPTHIHLLLKQVGDHGITNFMAKVLNSYTKYFNARHHRKGPLWEGHFKSVLVKNDDQLLHLTRYIHLNPTSAGLTDDPQKWAYSSLTEYLGRSSNEQICDYSNLIDLNPEKYLKFVLDQKDYQRSLAIIKSHLIDNYSG